MTNTVAAENLAGRGEKDKEKVEKRRALGRGLESLLPGPRVVGPGQSGGAIDKQQVPHFVRNDKTIATSGDVDTRAGVPAAHRIDSIQVVVEETVAAELRSDGRTNASRPYTNPSFCAGAWGRDRSRFMRRRSRGCRGIWWSTWRLRISTRIRFRRGMSVTTRRWRSWRIRSRRMGWCSRSWCVRRRRTGRYILMSGRAAAACFEEGGEEDDSGAGAEGFAAAGGGDDDRREPAARGFECAGAGGSVSRVEQGIQADAAANWGTGGVVAGVGDELYAAAEAAAGSDATAGGEEDFVCGSERAAEAGERRPDFEGGAVCSEEGADASSRSSGWCCR